MPNTNFNNNTRFISFFIWCYFIIIFSQNKQLTIYAQDIGQNCKTSNYGVDGTCKLVYDCPQVLEDIQFGVPYKRCGFRRRYEIVCCPESKAKPTQPSSTPPSSVSTRISARYCDEYKSAIYQTFYIMSLAINSKPIEQRINKCGHDVIPLIVGGQLAGPREFPHMALLGHQNDQNKFTPWCGGSIISPKFILTAAHCRYSGDTEVHNVVVGDLNIDSDSDDASPDNIEVLRFIPHPSYHSRKKFNDIALVELKRNIDINPYRRPACLPETANINQNKFIATGWGHTEWAGEASSGLQKVVLEKFEIDECNKKYNGNVQDDLQFCAGSRNDSRDACQGDSGGPLQIYHPSIKCMYTIAGITSYGRQCGIRGTPGVYTRVSSYLDWIENIVW